MWAGIVEDSIIRKASGCIMSGVCKLIWETADASCITNFPEKLCKALVRSRKILLILFTELYNQ